MSDHFIYQPEKDQYTCPEGQKLDYTHTQENTSGNGYKSERRVYQSRTCGTCQQRGLCSKGQNNRTIQVSPRLIMHKHIAKQNLESEKGLKLRSQRGVDVESVFGQIKHNNQFRRFYTRGLKNVSTEWGIISIAHNIKKAAK